MHVHGPCTRAVDTAHENGCNFGQSCQLSTGRFQRSRFMGVLTYLFATHEPSRRPMFTGSLVRRQSIRVEKSIVVQSVFANMTREQGCSVYTIRVHGAVSTYCQTGRKHGRHFGHTMEVRVHGRVHVSSKMTPCPRAVDGRVHG